MKPEDIRAAIARGESLINREGGNSMLPLIKSKQPCLLSPIDRELKPGDIVYCKVKGRHFTHKVVAVDNGRYLIGNNHGKINGWTRDVIALATPLKEI